MTTPFTFITSPEFRSSVESDARELEQCVSAGAWKAAHVLAGSIVEAILVDYLAALKYKKQDPLKMSLVDAVAACQELKVLSDKTVGLSHAIRSYRNLIHPGRVVRLNEKVDEHGAKIAAELVKVIADEVSEQGCNSPHEHPVRCTVPW